MRRIRLRCLGIEEAKDDFRTRSFLARFVKQVGVLAVDFNLTTSTTNL